MEPTSAIAIDRVGRTLLSWGDPDRPLLFRSAIKPFQAAASQEAGASLAPEELAVACSSHNGSPVHLEIVRSVLRGGGLSESDLMTPPDWPLGPVPGNRLVAGGVRLPRPIFHTCSGKHAAWLRACRASSWPTSRYLEPDHPVQLRVRSLIEDATSAKLPPPGVDGCGAPTDHGSVKTLARAFGRLTADDRFRTVVTAMTRYPGLVSGSDREDGRLAEWFPGPVKNGAQGLMAASFGGVGLAVRAEAGSRRASVIGMIEMMRSMGLLPDAAQDALASVAEPPVLGGGRPVGTVAISEDRR